ncbi:hypothetical protein WNY78_07265 [Psychroserpens sp. AS72]|uniref:LGFP repeat-containing protein n=1 Tax=Psychroserpens sp. AS72 TaxID=3135775 RepID=UPI00316DAF18
METLLIDYNFDNLRVENLLGGGFEANFANSTVIAGPTASTSGLRSKAVDLGSTGKANVDLTGLRVNTKKFCIQIGFKVNANVASRQNIVESNFLPFAIYADKGKRISTFKVVTSVRTEKHNWTGVDNDFAKTLQVGKWYMLSLVYDLDTLGLFIGNELIAVHGFPNGLIKTNATKKMFFGTWVDGARNHLNGALSDFKWYDGIPSNLESLLDEKRSSAQWHITYKHAKIKSTINTGKVTQGIQYNASVGSHTQFYERCAIMYHESAGIAFEMHGSIFARFKTMRNKSELGYLVTDESRATKTSGRKSLFSKGGIYWSRTTGAFPVLGNIYLEYENLGESKKLGFPTRAESTISGGKQQIFQKCRMYYKNGSGSAKEVHGSILTRFLQTGGIGKWGFPITNETDILRNRRSIGKFSEFEHCTIYWKSGVGAFEVHGDIRRKYRTINGPLSSIGFPTSNEVDIPNRSGSGRMNTFEKGSILWFGSYNSICVARPFKIRIQRIHSRENEGFLMGQNDIHFYATVKDGSRQIYRKRFPTGGDYGDHNVINPNKTLSVEIVPNKVNQNISFLIDIRDTDPGNDDHLGKHTTVLNAANAWGYRQSNLVFNQSFSKIISFVWSIRPRINVASLSENQKWWSFDNFKTPALTKAQYAAAFSDVDSETEWWDIPDGLRNLYYKWVVKGIASGGNCFGMSLEAIYARKCNSLLNQPLNDVVEDRHAINEINIKHAYQVGAQPIWWFLGQFASGNTHDPKDVFIATRNAFRRGDNPVVCISQNYDFSGGPHCVMPYAWDTTSKPWRMKVMDPNFPGDDTKVFTIDPDKNEFKYVGSRTYKGDAWSGGRFHYMPFCILDTRPRTPVWDAIMLLLSGTILILADDSETISIKDATGKDLDGNGTRAKNVLKAGSKPEEYFASYVGLDSGLNLKPGQILLRREKQVTSSSVAEVVNTSSLTLNTIIASRRLTGFNTRTVLPSSATLKSLISNRSAHHILNDPEVANNLTADFKKKLKGLVNINSKRNFQHEIKGAKNGKLEYLIKSSLSEIKIESTIQRNELNTVKVSDLNTNACSIEFKSPNTKHVNLQVINKLGVNGDHVIIDIANIPVQANKSLNLNLKQGLTGLEIVNNGALVNLPVKFKLKLDGKNIAKDFTVPIDGAIRIKPSTIVNSNELIVSNIVKLFGKITKSTVINSN